MRKNNCITLLSWMSIMVFACVCYADNPIVQTLYTADPAPMVHDGICYVYTTHDEDVIVRNFFTMNDWRCYASTDMVNWTDLGSPLSYEDFKWARSNSSWAGQCIFRNGKFYFYVPINQKSGGNAIGVAVADKPEGPFRDAIGKPLLAGHGYIDPSVFIDDDGQAYLYWGNPKLLYVKLNEDMISYSGQVIEVPLTTESFGVRSKDDRTTRYEEGPWLYKRKDLYYMIFAAGPISEHIAYATGPTATGPWTFRDTIMPTQGRSFTNHPGLIDYKGNSYFFYHNGALPDGGGFHRSVCVEQFEFNEDGTIPTINMTKAGAPQIGTLNPYVKTEAETICWASGVKTERCSEGGMNVCSIENGDYIKIKGVDFGKGAASFQARVASETNGGSIEIRLDSPTGQRAGICAVSGTGGWQNWETVSCTVNDAAGVHDLYLVFTGDSGLLMNFNWWKFHPADTASAKLTPARAVNQLFQPTFESLEKSNPAPEWFKDAKFGIYFHWGVYSVPAFSNEWYPRNMYINGSRENRHHIEKYGQVTEWPYDNFITGAKDKQGRFLQFAPKLKSEGGLFDPEEWAQLFADAGARYAGPVAEHHDGFSMWASKVNPWNAKDTGPKLDLVGLLTEAIRKRNMKIILSMHHAYNITGFYNAAPKTDDPKLQILYGQLGKASNEALWLSKHREIIDAYQPDIIWQDFNLHLISRSVLLEFLAYYYNQAAERNKEVVATYKDGLNTRCAVLDYERGGPKGITENYWLTDDAISSSSWCYTEGIGYYSRKQVLHGFLDRISKNGNLLLNISPKADGSIPQEQKDILLAMGAWLKKYGEAVYATRAWEQYGEGPTKMGGAHGQMGPPAEGKAGDVRYTRSKDNTTLYAILLGWEEGQDQVVLNWLSSERMDGQKLKSVELINGRAGEYLPLDFRQEAGGLVVRLPKRAFEELAYVLKLKFEGGIPTLDRHVDLDCSPHYYIVPGNSRQDWVLGSDLAISAQRKEAANQWKLETAGRGIYRILNRQDPARGLEYRTSDHALVLSEVTGKDSQFWMIDDARSELFTISNKQNPDMKLSLRTAAAAGSKAGISSEGGPLTKWKFVEVCEMEQKPFKTHVIPGTIEAEDFDTGCPGDAFYDTDDRNEGGQYRLSEGVDIEKCSAGGFNVGWTKAGEWLAYTVTVGKSGAYRVSFCVASAQDGAKLHLECDGEDITGIVSVPNTAGYQTWQVVSKTVNLEAGRRLLKLVIDGDQVNLDKMFFEEIQ